MARRPALTKAPATKQTPRGRNTDDLPAGLPDGPFDDALNDPFDAAIHRPERGPATATAQGPVRVTVTVDTLVDRRDLGPTSHTFVAAGDEIPLGLEGYPRQPA